MTAPTPAGARPGTLRLGLRANLGQFSLLIGVNALVGGMVGQERTLLSLLATEVFGLAALTAALTYIVAFGVVKAATNFAAGALSDRLGRKPVLVTGWLVGLPVPALAMGLNEAAGYGAVALTAWLTGLIAARAGLRPEPFFLGLAYAGLGLGLSSLAVRETQGHAQLEAIQREPDAGASDVERTSLREVLVRTSFRERAMSAACQAGMVNNLNDGLAWGLLPVFFARHGLPVAGIGVLAATYPAVWGAGQLLTGPLSDRLGRKPLITWGMGLQAAALAATASLHGYSAWLGAAALLGVGTAMVYPTLLAAIGDVAHPHWRASAVGVYRLWRDAGFAIGALLAGAIADLAGLAAAIWTVAALTAASGLVVAVRMYETRQPPQPATA
jgi:MFS family permease